MKLLSVIHGPAFGGAHNQALRLAGPLRARGIETIVALPVEAEEAAARLAGGGVEVATIPLQRLRASPSPRLQSRFLLGVQRDIRSLRILARDTGADVVQVHGPTNPQAAFAASAEGRAVVWQLLDTRTPPLLRRAARPLMRRYADAVTTWGHGLAVAHPGATEFGERLFTVYPPVDAEAFELAVGDRETARQELGVGADELLVGAIGVLNPQKGHEHFIGAAAALAPARPNVRFAVLGASSPAHRSYEARLRRQVSDSGLGDRFRFVDPGERVPRLMQALDVLALTSTRRSEGMPTVILEAMVCGKPVAATDTGAVRELVADGVTGLLAPADDLDRIRSALLQLIDDEGLRRDLGVAGRRLAEERFALEPLADVHAAAYRTALAHRSRRAEANDSGD